mmetsp:Transcript_852/g.3096  ORF Transcript_852/g.3096 Transcript_852/m.3096 type:complete len:287 (-) Transcript_852:48-908(-)
MEELERQALGAKARLDATKQQLEKEQEETFRKHKTEEEKRVAKLLTPASLLREREEYEQARQAAAARPEDCIPDLPENEDAREFLRSAPTKGLFMPLGKQVKVMQCWRCKAYGHRTGDKECPLALSGNVKLEADRKLYEDPMARFIHRKQRAMEMPARTPREHSDANATKARLEAALASELVKHLRRKEEKRERKRKRRKDTGKDENKKSSRKEGKKRSQEKRAKKVRKHEKKGKGPDTKSAETADPRDVVPHQQHSPSRSPNSGPNPRDGSTSDSDNICKESVPS